MHAIDAHGLQHTVTLQALDDARDGFQTQCRDVGDVLARWQDDVLRGIIVAVGHDTDQADHPADGFAAAQRNEIGGPPLGGSQRTQQGAATGAGSTFWPRRQLAFGQCAGGEGIGAEEHGLAADDVARQRQAGEARFASLALPGDIIGSEAMLFGTYAFAASALTECELSPWPEGAASARSGSLLRSLATAQRRAADLVALRGGEAVRRVIGLIRIMANSNDDAAQHVVLPTRQDIADITALRLETVSRIIKRLERDGMLQPVRIDGVHATRSFAVDFGRLAV